MPDKTASADSESSYVNQISNSRHKLRGKQLTELGRGSKSAAKVVVSIKNDHFGSEFIKRNHFKERIDFLFAQRKTIKFHGIERA